MGELHFSLCALEHVRTYDTSLGACNGAARRGGACSMHVCGLQLLRRVTPSIVRLCDDYRLCAAEAQEVHAMQRRV